MYLLGGYFIVHEYALYLIMYLEKLTGLNIGTILITEKKTYKSRHNA